MKSRHKTLGLALAVAGAAVSYRNVARTRCLTWGARELDVTRVMPGDELITHPDIVSTRAISIGAPPAAIWPWLVQMGSGRGGVYTYDWIENLFGLNMHSANEILPQFQDLQEGDVQALGDKGPRMRVVTLDPERHLVLFSDDAHWVWSFGLYPTDEDQTMLVSRNRIILGDWSAPARLAYQVLMEPGSLIMERKMLLGIKQRAEGMLSGRRAHATGAIVESG